MFNCYFLVSYEFRVYYIVLFVRFSS